MNDSLSAVMIKSSSFPKRFDKLSRHPCSPYSQTQKCSQVASRGFPDRTRQKYPDGSSWPVYYTSMREIATMCYLSIV